ncbi:hypothetical protein ER576_16425, partial [Enterococcus faecalis]|nr:hypothetical protein [Enterococcus faecalis]
TIFSTLLNFPCEFIKSMVTKSFSLMVLGKVMVFKFFLILPSELYAFEFKPTTLSPFRFE